MVNNLLLAGKTAGLGGDPYYDNVVLLLNGDGTNGSTTFTDLSPLPIPQTITRYGSVSVNTSVKKYGTGSMSFNGSTGTYLQLYSSPYFSFTGDFTVEAWVYPLANTNGLDAIFSLNNTGSGGWNSQGNGLVLSLDRLHYGSTSSSYSSTTGINQWYHFAVARSGSTIRVFRNGTQVLSVTSSATLGNGTTNTPCIGLFDYYSGENRFPFNGYIDDLRVTKGVARYTTNFTPPETLLQGGSSSAISGDPDYSNVVLRITGDGTNGSTTILDYSPSPKTITAYSGAKISTSVKKYGTGSVSFDGSNDYLKFDSGLELGTGNFTVELWAYFNSIANDVSFISSTSGGDFAWLTSTGLNIGTLSFSWDNSFDFSPSTGVWYHIAFVRNGGLVKAFVDGSQVGSTSSNSKTYNGSSSRIGSTSDLNRYFNGYIDDLRVTKGVARYTSDFTPPTAALPTS